LTVWIRAALERDARPESERILQEEAEWGVSQCKRRGRDAQKKVNGAGDITTDKDRIHTDGIGRLAWER